MGAGKGWEEVLNPLGGAEGRKPGSGQGLWAHPVPPLTSGPRGGGAVRDARTHALTCGVSVGVRVGLTVPGLGQGLVAGLDSDPVRGLGPGSGQDRGRGQGWCQSWGQGLGQGWCQGWGRGQGRGQGPDQDRDRDRDPGWARGPGSVLGWLRVGIGEQPRSRRSLAEHSGYRRPLGGRGGARAPDWPALTPRPVQPRPAPGARGSREASVGRAIPARPFGERRPRRQGGR